MNINKILYIIITVLIVWIVGSLFVKILPWMILVGLILWAFFKLKKVFKGNKASKSSDDKYFEVEINKNEPVQNEDVIDVEYEEIKK
ncbi:MAG: hypothetical protein ACRC7N_12160 [Clostridium sp.]